MGDAPCPAPDGGWPATPRRGDIELCYDLSDLADTGAAVAVTVFHPGTNQAVLVVAAADLAAVEGRLRPQLGNSLCVVPSRWTKDQLDGVRDHLRQRWQSWDLYQLGPRHAEDGQAHIAAGLVQVLPDVAVWAASLPSAIVALERSRPGCAEWMFCPVAPICMPCSRSLACCLVDLVCVVRGARSGRSG